MVEFENFEEFIKEALHIIKAADERGIDLRLMGGAAIRYHCHCPASISLYEKLGRAPKHDMDFAAYSSDRPKMKALFVDLGYTPYISLMMTGEAGRRRQIYNDKSGEKAIDVIFDELKMCHIIKFKDRLEIDNPTIPLAELLLQKLQIVEKNEKDIQDPIILLREHNVGNTDKEIVNAEYIAKLLSNDWGFYFTATRNLHRLVSDAETYKESGKLEKTDQSTVNSRINLLLQRIEGEPKSLRWKIRAKVGTSKKWYNVVEEVERDTLS